MDRRSFMGRAISSAALAGAPAAVLGQEREGERPPADIQPLGDGRLRIRSWSWSGNAWRPLIAHAVPGDGGFRIEGPIDPGDRVMVAGWIKAQHR